MGNLKNISEELTTLNLLDICFRWTIKYGLKKFFSDFNFLKNYFFRKIVWFVIFFEIWIHYTHISQIWIFKNIVFERLSVFDFFKLFFRKIKKFVIFLKIWIFYTYFLWWTIKYGFLKIYIFLKDQIDLNFFNFFFLKIWIHYTHFFKYGFLKIFFSKDFQISIFFNKNIFFWKIMRFAVFFKFGFLKKYFFLKDHQI